MLSRQSPEDGSIASWIEDSPLHLLYRANRVANARLLEHAEKYGLTARQLQVLMVLSTSEGLSQVELASRMGMDPSTMAAVQRGLVAKNLVRRRRCTRDTRRYVLRLSDHAKSLVETLRPLSNAEDRDFLDILGPERAQIFLECLERIAKASISGTQHAAPAPAPAATSTRVDTRLPEDRSTRVLLP